ncbi:MAG: hypothetical protein NC394_06050 [Bacteroides sp.]|nr:hypothetical protein [Bacteroides sp.]
MKRSKAIVSVLSALTSLSLISSSVFASSLELEIIEGHASASCFTYEKNNTAWAHLWNPYNAASLYNTPDESAYGEGIQDLIVEFSVIGVEEPFTVFPGYQAYGDEEGDNEELSIWSQDDYVNATGSEYVYTIDRDGTYELAVPFRAMADAATDFWGENLIRVGILELCFNGVGNDDMTGFKYDSLSFEFLGVRQSKTSHSVEECAFNGGEPIKFTEAAEEKEEDDDDVGASENNSDASSAEETESSEEDQAPSEDAAENTFAATLEETQQSEQSDSSSEASESSLPLIIVIIAVIVLLAIVISIIIIKKKK